VSVVAQACELGGAAFVAAFVTTIVGFLASDRTDAPAAVGSFCSMVAHAFVPAIALVWLAKRARMGDRADDGVLPERWLTLGSFTLAISALALVAGGLLRAKTHHHALAGVTFAIALVVFGIALAPVLFRRTADESPGAASSSRAVVSVAFGGLAMVMALRALGGLGEHSADRLRAPVLVLFALLVSSVLASSRDSTFQAMASRWGIRAALVVVTVGLVWGFVDPRVTEWATTHGVFQSAIALLFPAPLTANASDLP
jgi:hypothetical protein